MLARYFEIDTPVNSSKGIKEFKNLSQELLGDEHPWYYNQAIMEFGATHCTPKQPLCASCPFSQSCLALKNHRIGELPVKIRGGKIRKRYFNYIVFRSSDDHTILEKRSGKGIWEGLYQFPLIETREMLTASQFSTFEEFIRIKGDEEAGVTLYNELPVIHKLSHQHIYTRFWIVDKKEVRQNSVKFSKVKEYPVPVLIANFINEYDLSTSAG